MSTYVSYVYYEYYVNVGFTALVPFSGAAALGHLLDMIDPFHPAYEDQMASYIFFCFPSQLTHNFGIIIFL